MPQSVKPVSVATAVPSYILEQRDVAAAAHRAFALRCTDFERLARVFKTSGNSPALCRWDGSVGHGLARTAGSRIRCARTLGLDRRTGYRAVGAEHAAIAVLRPQPHPAACTFIKELAGVGRHRLRFRGAAVGTGDDRLKKHGFSLWAPKDNPR